MKIRKTKWGDYEHIVKFPVLSNYFVHVIFTDHIGRSRKGRYGSEGAAEGAAALSSVAVNGHGHLFYNTEKLSEGIIAHEAWHAVFRMFEWVGAELDNEMVAYHLSYLVDRIASFRSHIEFWESNPDNEGEATNGSENSCGFMARVQGLSTHGGRTSTEARETGAPYVSSQADGSDGGYRSTPRSSVRTRA